MPAAVPTAVLPPLVVPFLLTLAISFLIGVGLRDYYEGESKFDTFGTVRTFVFIGMLGFMLYTLPEIGNWAFLLGLVTVVLFLLVYYSDKVRQKKSPGLIGVSIAQLTYAIGPVSIHQPAISIATKYTLLEFKDLGLQVLSFVVGFSDITPFVVSVLQGDLGLGTAQIMQAIIIASASNNLMKLIYAYLFGTRKTANLAALGMGPLAVISLVYVAIAL